MKKGHTSFAEFKKELAKATMLVYLKPSAPLCVLVDTSDHGELEVCFTDSLMVFGKLYFFPGT